MCVAYKDYSNLGKKRVSDELEKIADNCIVHGVRKISPDFIVKANLIRAKLFGHPV